MDTIVLASSDSDAAPLTRRQSWVQPGPSDGSPLRSSAHVKEDLPASAGRTEASGRRVRRARPRQRKPTGALAAGEAFRRQLASKRPAATSEALDASREAAAQGGAAYGVEPEDTLYDSGGEYQDAERDFIAADSSTDSGSVCPEEADGPHLGATFRCGSPSASEEEALTHQRARAASRQQSRAVPCQQSRTASRKRKRREEGTAGASSTAVRIEPKIVPPSGAAGAPSDAAGISGAALETPRSLAARRRRRAVVLSDASDSGADRDAAARTAVKEEGQTAGRRRSFVPASTQGQMPRTPPEPGQRTVTSFFQRRSHPATAAAAAAADLEDSDAEEPQPITLDDEDTGSLEDFIASDDTNGGGGISGQDDDDEHDPVPAALQRLRDRLGADTQLSSKFAEFACGLLHDILGVPMDRALAHLSDEGRWAVRDALETGCHEISGNLGWVNAQRNGVIDALRALTYSTTAHDVNERGGGLFDDEAEEVEENYRDGRFVCEICGRVDPVKSVTLSGPCKGSSITADSVGADSGVGGSSSGSGIGGIFGGRDRRGRIALHSASPSKSCRFERRRPQSPEASDEEPDASEVAAGPATPRRSRGRGTQRSLHEAFGGEAPQRHPKEDECTFLNERTFLVGSGCVRRLMLAQLLWHWTCLFADKLRSIVLDPSRTPRIAARGSLKQQVAQELDDRHKLIRFWHGRFRSMLGLAKKVQTKWPRKHALSGVGPEILKFHSEFDKQFTDDR